MVLTEGTLISEHYKLQKQLGHGSFGNVWLARNLLADINVAIKFYGAFDSNGLDEFRNEFKIAYRLRHPNLLNINHFDVCEDCPYLVMPYCENGSVSRQMGQMHEQEIWKFVLDVSSGLAFLHSQDPPIIHHDIKPDNILITGDGRYVISDFGISRNLRTRMSRMHSEGVTSGTIAYMGPERFSENPMVVLASDVWAFGMTLYEVMCGDVLWEGRGGCAQLNGARIPYIESRFSRELVELVKSCLALETYRRPTAKLVNDYAKAYINREPLPLLPSDNYYSRSGSIISDTHKSDRSLVVSEEIPKEQYTSDNHFYSLTQNKQPISNDSIWNSLSLTNRNRRRLLWMALLVLGVLVLTSGIVAFYNSIIDEKHFVHCESKADYEQFIKDYPSSRFVEAAKKRIASMEGANIQQVASQQNMPEQHAEAVEKIEQPHREEISVVPVEKREIVRKQDKKIPAKTYPTDEFTLDDQTFFRCRTAKEYHEYLTKFPNGKHRAQAEIQLTSLVNNNQTVGNQIGVDEGEDYYYQNTTSRSVAIPLYQTPGPSRSFRSPTGRPVGRPAGGRSGRPSGSHFMHRPRR